MNKQVERFIQNVHEAYKIPSLLARTLPHVRLICLWLHRQLNKVIREGSTGRFSEVKRHAHAVEFSCPLGRLVSVHETWRRRSGPPYLGRVVPSGGDNTECRYGADCHIDQRRAGDGYAPVSQEETCRVNAVRRVGQNGQ